jgi:hypothetical protein
MDVHHLWLRHEDDIFSGDQVWMDTPCLDRQGTLVIFCDHRRCSHKSATSQTDDLGCSGEIAHMSQHPPYSHSDTVKVHLYLGVEVPTPSLEDETERGIPRRGVMQHPQHVVEEGEHNGEVFKEIPPYLEAISWNAEVLHNPVVNLHK